jgi:hypothetical protein
MLMYGPLSAYFDDVIHQQPALSNDGKQRQPALGDFTSPIIQITFSRFGHYQNCHLTLFIIFQISSAYFTPNRTWSTNYSVRVFV